MAFILHFDEHTREVLNIIRKALDPLLVFASRSGRSVLQRSVCLTPRRLAPVGSSAPDNHVRASSCQAMKPRYGHMRELRVQSGGRPIRVFYAFDPRRVAILLIGGDKTGNDRFYDQYVMMADKLYDEHLETLQKEGLIP